MRIFTFFFLLISLNAVALEPGVYVEKQPHIYTSNQIVTIFEDGTLIHEQTLTPQFSSLEVQCRTKRYGVIVKEDFEMIEYKLTTVELNEEYASIQDCIDDLQQDLLIISGEQSWYYGDGLYGIIEKADIVKKE